MQRSEIEHILRDLLSGCLSLPWAILVTVLEALLNVCKWGLPGD